MHEPSPDTRTGERERELTAIGADTAALYHREQRAEAVGDVDLARALHERQVTLEAQRLRLIWDRRQARRARVDAPNRAD